MLDFDFFELPSNANKNPPETHFQPFFSIILKCFDRARLYIVFLLGDDPWSQWGWGPIPQVYTRQNACKTKYIIINCILRMGVNSYVCIILWYGTPGLDNKQWLHTFFFFLIAAPLSVYSPRWWPPSVIRICYFDPVFAWIHSAGCGLHSRQCIQICKMCTHELAFTPRYDTIWAWRGRPIDCRYRNVAWQLLRARLSGV